MHALRRRRTNSVVKGCAVARAVRPVRARRAATAAASVLAVGVLGACGEPAADGPAGGALPVIVATTGIWADVVRNTACDGQAEVVSLLPPGGDPHTYEPSMADRARLDDAVLVVANGLGLESGLEDTLAAVEQSGVAVFRAGDHVATIDPSGGGHGDGTEGAGQHDGDGADPHIWQDPTRVALVVQELGDALVEAGLEREEVDACVADQTAALAVLDAEVEAVLADLPPQRRVLVTNHDALGYFADRYGLEILGTVIPSPGSLAETNPADIERLARAIDEAGVPAVFSEVQHSDREARALAERVGGVEVVTLHTDALGEEGSGAETYLDLVRRNAELIAAALGGSEGP